LFTTEVIYGFFYISLRLNTGVRKESNRGNGLVKEIKLILSWQQPECVWVLGHHFIAHVLSLEGWFQWGERESFWYECIPAYWRVKWVAWYSRLHRD